MTTGEKIQYLRKQKNITQEALAEELNVSRSAIAKWESDHGMPEIGNLKMLAALFSVSIDALIDESQTPESVLCPKTENEIRQYNSDQFCNIELTGWNDGVFDVLIIGEDTDFCFYQKTDRKKKIYGLLGKKYITSIEATGEMQATEVYEKQINRDFVCGKPVKIELANRKGLFKGFFDFRNDDYRNVVIQSISASRIQLRFAGEIDIADVCKIETL